MCYNHYRVIDGMIQFKIKIVIDHDISQTITIGRC